MIALTELHALVDWIIAGTSIYSYSVWVSRKVRLFMVFLMDSSWIPRGFLMGNPDTNWCWPNAQARSSLNSFYRNPMH